MVYWGLALFVVCEDSVVVVGGKDVDAAFSSDVPITNKKKKERKEVTMNRMYDN